MPEPTARDIAIVLLSVTDTDTRHPHATHDWAVHYMAENEGAEHSGDCKKQPWTCCRCVCDDYKIQGAAALPILQKLFTV